MDDLQALGISYTQVTDALEVDGLAKFEASWDELMTVVREQQQQARE